MLKELDLFKVFGLIGIVVVLTIMLTSCGGYQPPGGEFNDICKAIVC